MSLEQFDNAFRNAKPTAANDPDAVPDGKYNAEIEAAEFTLTKEKRSPMLSWRFRILDGEYKGEAIFKNSVIASDQQAEFLASDLFRCGLKLNSLTELPENAWKLVGVNVRLLKKTKANPTDASKPYVNIYINSRIVDSPVSASGVTDADMPENNGMPKGADGKDIF